MVTMVSHGQCLLESLGFVVDAAWTDGVDIAPVGFCLRVDFGVAIDLRG